MERRADDNDYLHRMQREGEGMTLRQAIEKYGFGIKLTLESWLDSGEYIVAVCYDGKGTGVFCNMKDGSGHVWSADETTNDWRVFVEKKDKKEPVVRWLWCRRDSKTISTAFYTETELPQTVAAITSRDAWIKLEWSRTEFEE